MKESWRIGERAITCSGNEQESSFVWQSLISPSPKELHQKIKDHLSVPKNQYFLDDIRVDLDAQANDGQGSFSIKLPVNQSSTTRFGRAIQIESIYHHDNGRLVSHCKNCVPKCCKDEEAHKRSVELLSHIDEVLGVEKTQVYVNNGLAFHFIEAGFVPDGKEAWSGLAGLLSQRLDHIALSPGNGVPALDQKTEERIDDILNEQDFLSLRPLLEVTDDNDFCWGEYLLSAAFSMNGHEQHSVANPSFPLSLDWNNSEHKQHLINFRKDNEAKREIWQNDVVLNHYKL